MSGRNKEADQFGPLGGPITHWAIFRRYWLSIIGTLGLIMLSAGLWLFQPYLLGLAIDGLVEDDWLGVAYLAALQVGVLIIGGARRYYDTRVYARIYRDIGAEAVSAAQAAGVEITRTAARANMLREVVNFFEFRVPSIIRASIDLVGSLVLLAFLSMNVFYASLGALGAILLSSVLFGGRLLRLNKGYNDQLEQEIDAYQANSRRQTDAHLSALAQWQIRRSDTQVWIFGLTSFVLMGVVLYALYDTVSVKEAAIGTVFAIISYVRRFQIATFEFPAAYQQIIRTLEITRRINEAWRAPAETLKRDAVAMRFLGELGGEASRDLMGPDGRRV
ncbi:MAG: ABC transporter six-transmembrane domain-containing protein [Pseudomonadota bacterium]